MLVLRDRMIADRSTVGEMNAVRFALKLKRTDPLPPGHCARWDERARLCVAKLHAQLLPDTSPDDFAGILLRVTGNRNEDEFVEVHI